MSADVRRMQRLLALQRRLEDSAAQSSLSAASQLHQASHRLHRAREAASAMEQADGATPIAALRAAAHWRTLMADAVGSATAMVGSAEARSTAAQQRHAVQRKRRERMESDLVAAIRAAKREHEP